LLKWGFWDALVVRLAPALSFFVATDLLEEMFLHVHTIMEQQPEQSFGPARQVMALHAREEKSHLSMDARVIRERLQVLSPWRFALESWASLLNLWVVDRKVSRAWRSGLRRHQLALGLSEVELRALKNKQLSRSDAMGIERFLARWAEGAYPGGRLLEFSLRRMLPTSA
jgi:hypothetical protein